MQNKKKIEYPYQVFLLWQQHFQPHSFFVKKRISHGTFHLRDEFLHPPSIVVPAIEFAWFSICDLLQVKCKKNETAYSRRKHIHDGIFINNKSLYKTGVSSIGDTSAVQDKTIVILWFLSIWEPYMLILNSVVRLWAWAYISCPRQYYT